MEEGIRCADGGAVHEGARAGRERAAPGQAPSARWPRAVLTAPGLALLGVVLLVATALLDTRHGRQAEAVCHRLPVPWTLFALAYGAVLCGAAAPVLCFLFFRAAARTGRRGTESWQGTLALCICVADALALLLEAVAVYGVHAEAGDPYWRCSGARALAGLHTLMQSHVL